MKFCDWIEIVTDTIIFVVVYVTAKYKSLLNTENQSDFYFLKLNVYGVRKIWKEEN